ncbi:MAG: hypothetical protein WCR72_17340 [Bacteroidota bacterium]
MSFVAGIYPASIAFRLKFNLDNITIGLFTDGITNAECVDASSI